MTDPVADAARAAAVILVPDHGPHLPAEVEAALAARSGRQHPDRFVDPVSVASLIVAIATLAWTIYTTQCDRHQVGPTADAVARLVRITLRENGAAPPPGYERITDIIATEITRHPGPPR